MKYRLKNQEAQDFFDVYSNGKFSEILDARIKWVLSRHETLEQKERLSGLKFSVIVPFTTSFAHSVNLLISSVDIDEYEECQ